jgi:ATP-dependent RNA helicase DeaD
VGCITGESGIAGGKVGRIDIREGFSVVEVAAEVAERVLRSLTHATLRGRAVNARPFREHA